jgi:hypothetical protein
MAEPERTGPKVPINVGRYLQDQAVALRKHRVGRVRLLPLLLEVPLGDLLRRRAGFFQQFAHRSEGYGFAVDFSRLLRPSAGHPQGRSVTGSFDILVVTDQLSILASSLPADCHRHGPALLAERAYPLAKRPFLTSPELCRLVGSMADRNNWDPIAVDAMGYDRRTLKFRRDLKPQPVEDAFREMSTQGRQVHKVKVSFRDSDRREVLLAAVDRHAETTVYAGNLGDAVTGLLFPAIDQVSSAGMEYAVPRAAVPAQQEALVLSFPEDQFTDYDDMNDLCQALRKQDGLSVTTVHLNPYLQAQVLDFFSGAAVELLVTDDRTVSLIPRSGNCKSILEKIAETVFFYFGEATPRRERLVPV